MTSVPAPASRAAEWSWVLLTFLLLNLNYAATQPIHPGEGLGEGGQIYHAMASAMPRELPPAGVAPFVYRLGMPMAATVLAKSLDWVVTAGFDRLNLVFNALSVVLLTLLMQRHVSSVFARMVVIVAFMVEPHSPLRLSYVHPLSTDSVLFAGLMAGLVGIEWFQSRPTPRRASLLAVLVAIGVIVHEAMLLVALCTLFCRLPGTAPAGAFRSSRWAARFRALDQSGAWLPLIIGLVTLAAVRAWVVPTPSDYSPGAELARWFREKTLLQYVLAWFLVFGPFLAFPLFFWQRTLRFLRAHAVFLVFLSICSVWAWLGSGQTERVLALASPVVYIVMAQAWTHAGVGATPLMAGVLFVQAVSSRAFSPIGGPIAPPVVRTEVWERLGWADVTSALSYQNMWSQFCTPAMLNVYLAWYGLAGGSVLALLWYRARGDRRDTLPEASMPVPLSRTWTSGARSTISVVRSSNPWLLVSLATALAMAPVVWLASSGFLASHYAEPGYAYLPYNLARIWMVAILFAAFWATGSRLIACGSVSACGPALNAERDVDAVFAGAAAWSVAVAVLAMLHLYYVWVILPAVTAMVALAIVDLTVRNWTRGSGQDLPAASRWGLAGILLRLAVFVTAAAVLIGIALWGHFGGDNDVPGNYLPYYSEVLRTHTNAAGEHWVHFFATKGNGLAFLANALSDVNGAALATYLMLLAGAAMIWRLAGRAAPVAPAIGLIGACLLLEYYGGQGAYAKPHLIRNVFLLYIILSGVRALAFHDRGASINRASRLAVVTAVVVLSPLALVLLLPILFVEAALLAVVRGASEVRRAVVAPVWALGATALVCGYNYFQVGLPELHNMPSFVGRFVNVERFSRWIDPGLSYLDYRLAFMQMALPGGDPAGTSAMTFAPTQSLAHVLMGLLSPATLVFVLGAVITLAVGLGSSRTSAASVTSPSRFPGVVLAVAYLLVVMAMLAVLQTFGGGAGSSMGRFTDFATPLGIALAVVVFTAVYSTQLPPLRRRIAALVIVASGGVGLYLGSGPVLALPWRASTEFMLGRTTYAAMNEEPWDTLTASRIVRSVPAGARVELLNFLPGVTAVPGPQFQRPDGNAYLKDYTTVLYGSADRAAAIYTGSDINYFLFDVSPDAPVMWSGFSPLFTTESIRSKMRLVAHQASARRSLYLLTWRQNSGAPVDELNIFLREWGTKLASEKDGGYFYAPYAEGFRRTGQHD